LDETKHRAEPPGCVRPGVKSQRSERPCLFYSTLTPSAIGCLWGTRWWRACSGAGGG
jgi:hypothetical protein